MRFLILLPVAVLVMVLPATAVHADWGLDPWLSHADMVYEGEATLLIMPDGSGKAFGYARNADGQEVDATIILQLYDYLGDPVVDFPAEDIWLASMDGGMVPCLQGAVPESATDASGQTRWTNPLHAGGNSEANCQVMVSGFSLLPGMPLHFNSPDLNGDLEVNLADVGMFTHDFYQGYSFRADLHRDGVLNISDLGWLAQGLGTSCP